MSTELLIRILSGELPLDGPLQGVSGLLPSIDLLAQELSAVDAPGQALAAKDAALNLRHVKVPINCDQALAVGGESIYEYEGTSRNRKDGIKCQD